MKYNYKQLILPLLMSLTVLVQGQEQDTACVGENGSIEWHYWSDIQGYNIENLYADPFYPQGPEIVNDIFGIEAPQNFNDYFGAIIKGFIKIPETGYYQFNVTGDDRAHFYLSDGTAPSGLSLICESDGYSGNTEHDRYPEQTSDSLMLEAGDYHYFELHHKGNGGSDDATVYWKTPFLIDTLWFKINGPYLYKYTCNIFCEDQGTPCDDGDTTTVNDVFDGYCNCSGQPYTKNTCIGERGSTYALYWDDISGNGISNLLDDPNYPMSPDRADLITDLKIPVNQGNIYGTQIQGYLSIPVDGNYVFNITGDDNSEFYLSTSDNPNDLELVAEVPGWTHDEEYDKYEEQTSDSIYLESNEYYFFRVLHKEGYGGDHVYINWRPPFALDTNWRVVNGFFVYGYECDLACIPDGTPCDDGDPNTSGDVYLDCDCMGTPCGGPCDDEPSYAQFEACALTDNHSTSEMDSWLSCEASANPNPARDTGIWIMYDLGSKLKIINNTFWNYNVEGLTGLGAKNVIVDYSLDGTNWTELGQVIWPEAPGDPGYTGDSIPSLNQIRTQYLLFTIVDNWDNTDCMGFSEIKFTVERCQSAGTPCDDGNELTLNDMYDKDCNCKGLPIPANDCDPTVLLLPNNMLSGGLYDAADSVVSHSVIDVASQVTMVAGQGIILDTGFTVELGAVFYATPLPCDTAQSGLQAPDGQTSNLSLYPARTEDWTMISFTLNKTMEASVVLKNTRGEQIMTLVNRQIYDAGIHQKKLAVHQIPEGIYLIELDHADGSYTKRLVVLKAER